MARKGIAPLSTTIARAFTNGSSTTSQRPTPKKITAARTKPAPPPMKTKRRTRERETTAGLSAVAIGESAHAIPPSLSGQPATKNLHALAESSSALPAWRAWGKLRGEWRKLLG